MTLEFRTEFDEEESDILRNQGVDLDDWDYAIFAPVESIEPEQYEEEVTDWEWFPFVRPEHRVWEERAALDGSWHYREPSDRGHWVTRKELRTRWRCTDWDLERLLTGCYANRWYRVEWKGEIKAVGLAYHG